MYSVRYCLLCKYYIVILYTFTLIAVHSFFDVFFCCFVFILLVVLYSTTIVVV